MLLRMETFSASRFGDVFVTIAEARFSYYLPMALSDSETKYSLFTSVLIALLIHGSNSA